MKLSKSPQYLHRMHHVYNYQYRTRQADFDMIKLVGKPRLEITENSYKWRASSQFNELPTEIRNCESLDQFKLKTRKWIRENVLLS